MRNSSGIIILFLCMVAFSMTAHAAPKPGKAIRPGKERLVLMPLRVSDEDKSLAGAMETALVEGLQQKYEVFSGEQVAQKANAIFLKESKNTSKKDCDETRCMQDIAEAFQAELIATANLTKRADGYFLALNVQNIFDNKAVYSKSMPCKNCDAYEVVEKLKELSGASVPSMTPATMQTAQDQPIISVNKIDPESALWNEVQKSSSVDDYAVYLAQYPKGKYVALAKSRRKKLQELEAAAAAQQEQGAWESANSKASEESYAEYLGNYPRGQYAGLANTRIAKLKKEAALLASQAPKAVKANKATKERLVLMPPSVPDEDKSLAGSMEAALVEGLQQKYEVFSGEQVARIAKDIFRKASQTATKKPLDETLVMQDISLAFQAELIATANVNKRPDGYFLALSVQNIFDNKVVYSKTATCEYCSTFRVIEKLKELSGAGPVMPAR